MLYNLKWEKAPSLAGFATWLETKDPNETYDFANQSNCAVAQYLADFKLWDLRIAVDLNHLAYQPGHHTFGELLERVRSRARQ